MRVVVRFVKVMTLLIAITLSACSNATSNDQPAATKDSNEPSVDCKIFSADNIWNTRVDCLAVAARSVDYINSIGPTDNLHPDFGSGTWDGEPIGIPFNTAGGGQALAEVSFYWPEESDPGPYPIPNGVLIEGGENSDGDRHVLVLDQDSCKLYELFDAWPNGDGSWSAGSGAIFDLGSNALRPEGWTSADAAGLPILPGLVRYDEVAAGEINHALRFTVAQTQRAYVWPARHFASSLTEKSFPPMGQRFRLKADFDISSFPRPVQVILTALKRYGVILADNGSDWFISGVPDERWDNDMLNELKKVRGESFEAVDISTVMVSRDSGEALPLCEP